MARMPWELDAGTVAPTGRQMARTQARFDWAHVFWVAATLLLFFAFGFALHAFLVNRQVERDLRADAAVRPIGRVVSGAEMWEATDAWRQAVH